MSVIEQAIAHFKAFGVRHIDVPEWGAEGAPLRVYWQPMNLAERARFLRGEDVGLDRFADVLVEKALDADGKRLFTLEDKQKLLRGVDPAVVIRVGTAIAAAVAIEDSEKN